MLPADGALFALPDPIDKPICLEIVDPSMFRRKNKIEKQVENFPNLYYIYA
jgi:hypothetical protein